MKGGRQEGRQDAGHELTGREGTLRELWGERGAGSGGEGGAGGRV